MQCKVRPSSKSPTKQPRQHVITAKKSSKEIDNEGNDFTTTPSSQSFSGSPSLSSASSVPKNGKLCCDKCDGKHETIQCPYYKTKRGSHPDEQKNFYKKLGGVSNLPGQTLRSARVVRQPGDGSCLFHSMSHGKFQ
jgi:hypothetical protein